MESRAKLSNILLTLIFYQLQPPAETAYKKPLDGDWLVAVDIHKKEVRRYGETEKTIYDFLTPAYAVRMRYE